MGTEVQRLGRRRGFVKALIVAIGVQALLGTSIAVSASAPGTRPAAKAPEGPVRYVIDPERRRTWWLTDEGVVLHDLSRTSSVRVTLPGWHWARPVFNCMPDIALGPAGEVVVTSNLIPKLWRIDPENLAVSTHTLSVDADPDKDIGFSALVYSSRHTSYFGISETNGTLWRIDKQLSRAQKLSISRPLIRACRIAVAADVTHGASARATTLCVRGSGKEWTIELAGDSAAAVRPAASGACRSD